MQDEPPEPDVDLGRTSGGGKFANKRGGGKVGDRGGNAERRPGEARFRKGQTSKVCRLCQEEKGKDGFSGSKDSCKECWPDFEASRRDAVRQQELETWNEINKDDELMREFIEDWRRATPLRRGPGNRRGGYQFARFKKRIGVKRGVRRARAKVMLTKKQFVERMEAKGKPKAWAEAEFGRRLQGNTEWKVGTDEDTKLTTVQAYGSGKEEVYSDDFQEGAVEIETKAAKAFHKHVANLLEGLAEEPEAQVVASAFEKGTLIDTLPEFAAKSEEKVEDYTPTVFLVRKAGPESPGSTACGSGSTVTSSPMSGSGDGLPKQSQGKSKPA